MEDFIRDIDGIGEITSEVFARSGLVFVKDVLDDSSTVAEMVQVIGEMRLEYTDRSVTYWRGLTMRCVNLFNKIKAAEKATLVPEPLLCPITFRLFDDPVVAPDGTSFERRAIVRWIEAKHTNPMTREPLSIHQLVDNKALRDMIAHLKAHSSVTI